MTCSIENCDRPAFAKGWCQRHYTRISRYGDPNAMHQAGGWNKGIPTYSPEKRIEVFWSRVTKTETCWFWTGGTQSDGYGEFWDGTRRVPAHRYAYRLEHGDLPDSRDLDHTCHNFDIACNRGRDCPHRRCVNPAHLEPVTTQVNIQRGRLGYLNLGKSHCPQGHPYDAQNTYVYKGSRYCRACRAEGQRNYRQRQGNV